MDLSGDFSLESGVLTEKAYFGLFVSGWVTIGWPFFAKSRLVETGGHLVFKLTTALSHQ